MKKLFLTALLLGTILFATNQAQAAIVNLTVTGSEGEINGAIFFQGWPDVSGTGLFDPFVRIQNNGTEQGYNTDGADPFDVKDGRSLRLNAISTILHNNIIYREFALDMGQNNDQLSLDQLKIYLHPSNGSFAGTDLGTLGGTLVYNLDSGEDSYVYLNHTDSGNGNADLTVYVPNSLFNVYSNPYVYFYSQFGTNNYTNDGFEEWSVRKDVVYASTPEPTSLSLLGIGLLGLAGLGRKRIGKNG